MEKDCVIISWGVDTVINLEMENIKEHFTTIHNASIAFKATVRQHSCLNAICKKRQNDEKPAIIILFFFSILPICIKEDSIKTIVRPQYTFKEIIYHAPRSYTKILSPSAMWPYQLLWSKKDSA